MTSIAELRDIHNDEQIARLFEEAHDATEYFISLPGRIAEQVSR